MPGTHRKIWLAICGKLATAPPTAWTHCGVDMASSFHALFISMVGGRKGPLVQQRRITRYKYRVWQHQSNPEHQRKWPSDYPSCDKSYVVSDKKLGPGVENFMFWWPTASRCTPKPGESYQRREMFFNPPNMVCYFNQAGQGQRWCESLH